MKKTNSSNRKKHPEHPNRRVGLNEFYRPCAAHSSGKRYRAHPISMLDFIAPFFFIILLPIARLSLNSMMNKEQPIFLFSEMVGIAVIIVYVTIKWKLTYVWRTQGGIKFTSGLVFRKILEIPCKKITVVEATTDLRGRIFGCTVVRISTVAGIKGKADFQIRMYNADAAALLQEIGTQGTKTTFKFSPLCVAIMAASVSSAFSGLVFTVPALKRIGDLLGMAIEQVVIDRLNELTAVNRIFPPAVNTAAIILVVLYGIAFLISFFKSANFKLKLGNCIEVQKGLITRKRFYFRAEDINGVIMEQTPIMRIFRRYLLKVNIAGYGNRRADKAVLVPSVTEGERNTVFSFVVGAAKGSGKEIKPHPSQKRRFYLIPTIFLFLSMAASLITALLFAQFREFIIFSEFIILLIVFYFFGLAQYNSKHSSIIVENIVIARCSRWSAIRTVFCDAKKIGIVDIVRWPRDRRESTCKMKIIQRTKNIDINTNTIKLKCMPYEETVASISALCGCWVKIDKK